MWHKSITCILAVCTRIMDACAEARTRAPGAQPSGVANHPSICLGVVYVYVHEYDHARVRACICVYIWAVSYSPLSFERNALWPRRSAFFTHFHVK